MICVFGTVCLDRIRHVRAIPKPGAYVEVDTEILALGGEAANTASHLARWGASARLVGNALAGDMEGVLLVGYLAEHGLHYDTHAVAVESTPVCDVYVTPDGERTMFGLGFKSMSMPTADRFEPTPGSWFTIDGNFGESAELYGARARDGGMSLYLMDLPPTSELLGPGTIWQTSTRWVGERGDSAANAELVRGIVERTGCTAILTDSARGMTVGRPDSAIKTLPVFSRPGVRDSTGAGDTLRAGILYGLDQNWPLFDALRFGAAAAALAADYIGAAEGPSRAAVEAHVAAHPDIAGQYA